MDYRWHVPGSDENDHSRTDRWFDAQRDLWGKVDEHVPENVRQRREELGLSQEDLAQMMSKLDFPWHQSTVYKIESGVRRVSLSEGMALASLLKMTATSLVGAPEQSKELREFQRAVNDARHKWLGLGEIAQRFLLAREELRTRHAVIENLIEAGKLDPDAITVEALEDIEAARRLVVSHPYDAVNRGPAPRELREHSWLPVGMKNPPSKERADEERLVYRAGHSLIQAFGTFTDAENDVFQMVLRGYSTQQISSRLDISEDEVRPLVESAMAKLGERLRDETDGPKIEQEASRGDRR